MRRLRPDPRRRLRLAYRWHRQSRVRNQAQRRAGTGSSAIQSVEYSRGFDGTPMTNLQPVLPAKTRSLWLQEALALEPDAESVEPLIGSHRTDVCIVGGGYTGLWTALRIKELDPSIDVTILEADICGGGASGRNGGLALGWWYKLKNLISGCGEEEGVR